MGEYGVGVLLAFSTSEKPFEPRIRVWLSEGVQVSARTAAQALSSSFRNGESTAALAPVEMLIYGVGKGFTAYG